MSEKARLREHLQWWLVGPIHYGYVDAAAHAVAMVRDGRGADVIEIPLVPLVSADSFDVPLAGDALPASELVEKWDLGAFVRGEAPE